MRTHLEHTRLDIDEAPGARQFLEEVSCIDKGATLSSLNASIFPGPELVRYAMDIMVAEDLHDLFLSLTEEAAEQLHSSEGLLYEALIHKGAAIILADILEEGPLAALSLPWSLNYVAGKRRPNWCESRQYQYPTMSSLLTMRAHCAYSGSKWRLRPTCQQSICRSRPQD